MNYARNFESLNNPENIAESQNCTELVESNFDVLNDLHFFDVANTYGRQAMYLGALPSILADHGIKDEEQFANMNKENFDNYLNDVAVKTESREKIFNYHQLDQEKLLEFILHKLDRNKVKKSIGDLMNISSEKIINSLDPAMTHCRERICNHSPLSPRVDQHIGPFWETFSAGLCAAFTTEKLPRDNREKIILYSLLERSGAVNEYNNPLWENINNDNDLANLIEKVNQFHRMVMDVKYTDENKATAYHFIRNGYGHLNKLQSLKLVDGVLTYNYAPMLDKDKKSFNYQI